MGIWKRLSRGLGTAEAPARGKAGARAYAVGDIHGRLDLLDELLENIERDMAERQPAKTFVIFLGDLIDRGPNSAGVVERLRNYRPPAGATPIFLAGNHEEVLLRILAGERKILPQWLKFGGAECARSYGIDPDRLRVMNEQMAIFEVQRHVPREHRAFLESFADTFRFGDYLFVHAGIRPGVGIDHQSPTDLRWIREPFLSDGKEHGCMVVHGHTIVPEVEERRNRIAIDTGAYHSGVLSALGIEERRRWTLTTGSGEGLSAAA